VSTTTVAKLEPNMGGDGVRHEHPTLDAENLKYRPSGTDLPATPTAGRPAKRRKRPPDAVFVAYLQPLDGFN